jgi:hypothetical protein
MAHVGLKAVGIVRLRTSSGPHRRLPLSGSASNGPISPIGLLYFRIFLLSWFRVVLGDIMAKAVIVVANTLFLAAVGTLWRAKLEIFHALFPSPGGLIEARWAS